jgi:hypothetical protein
MRGEMKNYEDGSDQCTKEILIKWRAFNFGVLNESHLM